MMLFFPAIHGDAGKLQDLGMVLAPADPNHKFCPMKNQVISIYRQTERFAEITQKLIVSGNIQRVKKCLAVAERLLKNGNTETRNVIAGVYIHSVSTFMEMRHCSISGLFPQDLKAAYIKQINTTGI